MTQINIHDKEAGLKGTLSKLHRGSRNYSRMVLLTNGIVRSSVKSPRRQKNFKNSGNTFPT